MESIQIAGHVDQHHRLVAEVPLVVHPGPVTVWISPATEEDEAGAVWATAVTSAWAEELNDNRQDIYSLDDGEPIDQA